MGDKLVGSVGIKIRPDATTFRRDAEDAVKKATSDIKADIPLNPTITDEEKRKLKTDVEAVAKEASGDDISMNVILDQKGIDKAIADIEAKLRAANFGETIKVSTDTAELEKLKAELEELQKGSRRAPRSPSSTRMTSRAWQTRSRRSRVP